MKRATLLKAFFLLDADGFLFLTVFLFCLSVFPFLSFGLRLLLLELFSIWMFFHFFPGSLCKVLLPAVALFYPDFFVRAGSVRRRSTAY